ncbi:MAG TPA: HD domain-containing phosphohydrolase [Vicinamibacterales bacterium]|nr:HD domain-containing phosphohydrolase [Vicinamibacterales bacterium]
MGGLPDLDRYTVLDNLLEGCQVLGFDWRYLYVNHAVTRHGRRTREELLGHSMTDLYPGLDHTELFAVLRRCMDERTAGSLENEFSYPDGSSAWFELRIEPVPEGLFVLSLDVTARKQAERSMRHQIDRLRSLRAIDLAILSTTDFRVALKSVLEETTRRLGVDAAAVFLMADPTTLQVAASVGFRGPGVDRLTIRLGDGATGRAALRRRTVTIPDLSSGITAGHEMPRALLDEGIQGFCAVPLVAKGHLTGVLVAAHGKPLRVDDDWSGFLESLAGQAAMAIDAGKSYEDLERAHMELALAYETTIEGWAGALDLRDKETAHHTLRVTDLTMKLCRVAGLSDPELVHVRRGALLHDIGKMAVPDAILLKEGKLTDEEAAVMQRHPTCAYELLWPIVYLRPALDIPYSHHERWDGTGYPRGLKGDAIPTAARLFAVVDVWDALRSPRPYRGGWPAERAREELRQLAGTHLDPVAVDLFLNMMDAKQEGEDSPL